MVGLMEEGHKHMEMEALTRVDFCKGKKMDKGFTNGQMVRDTKVVSSMD